MPIADSVLIGARRKVAIPVPVATNSASLTFSVVTVVLFVAVASRDRAGFRITVAKPFPVASHALLIERTTDAPPVASTDRILCGVLIRIAFAAACAERVTCVADTLSQLGTAVAIALNTCVGARVSVDVTVPVADNTFWTDRTIVDNPSALVVNNFCGNFVNDATPVPVAVNVRT